MKRLAACAAVVAIAFVGGPDAEAGSHWGHVHTSSIGPTGGYSYTPTSYYLSVPRRTAVWHDTTHVDVIPARWVRGPSGWTYLPARRVLHVDGHYDVLPTYSAHRHHLHTH